MTKYVVTGKKPFYGPDCRTYQPGSVVDLIDFQEAVDADGNKRMIGMKPGRFLKPYAPKAEVPKAEVPDSDAKVEAPKVVAPAASKAATGRTT
jgi:hypothetical protein